jgi:hypothetical protein
MSQYAALKAANLWPAYDPYYKNVTLNLHGNGTNAAQNNTFLDSSGNNYPITRGGNATQGTFSPYGPNWSSYLGTNGNYFTSGTNAALGLSTGDWTIEFFLNVSQFVDNQFLIDFRPSGSGGATQPLIYLTTAGTLLYFTTSATRITSSAGVITLGTWAHIAVSRASGSTRMFVNGAQTGSTYTDSNDYGSSARFVNGTYGDAPGATNNNGGVISGYISNLRILKGTGLYTGSYTVPTAPLTAITNTSCLTFQSNRFIDTSSNNISITPTGSPSTQRFSPFSPTTAYSASTIGGSAYFDGTSANIITTNTITTIGTQDFCLEAWVYCFSTTSYACIIGNASIGLFIEMGTTRGIFISGPEVGLGSAQYNRWVHIAYSRVSGTYAGWVNGTRQATGSFTTNLSTAAKIAVNNYVDAGLQGYGTTGYIADGRVTVGSSPYSPSSTTITVPTAPLTAVTGTVFLASMTNAGIFDNAMMNDFQTVGDAQISTSVKKYGTGSMYFDGTGDGLTRPVTPLFDFGSGDYTVEFWAYCVSTSGSGFFVSVWEDSGGSDANASWLVRLNSGTVITHFMQGSGTYNTLTSPTLTANTWFHFAWVKNGTTQTMYINGTSVASGTVTGAMNTAIRSLKVGYQGAATNYLNGYIDDLRITKGVARYTGNFTPPTSQVQDQ